MKAGRPKLPKSKKRVLINARVLPEEHKALEEQAQAEGRTVSNLLALIVTRHVAAQRDLAKEAEELVR